MFFIKAEVVMSSGEKDESEDCRAAIHDCSIF